LQIITAKLQAVENTGFLRAKLAANWPLISRQLGLDRRNLTNQRQWPRPIAAVNSTN
jgi:hypothetical protein